MRTLISVPTHNEAANISELLDRVRDHVADADVVVVDDASTDGTRELVRNRRDDRIRLIERPDKRGLGDAYRVAFALAVEEGYDAIVQIDADLSHDPAALPLMLAIAERGVPLVIGSRYVPGGTVTGWPRRRTWLSRWANRYVAVMLGLAINDATAGFRVYRVDALADLGLDGLEADGYGFQVEMTYRAVRAGLAVVEVPIAFRDRIAGRSKMSRTVVVEAFRLVTAWGVHDLVTLRRRQRAYRTSDDELESPGTVSPGAVSPGTVSPGAVSPGAVSPVARFADRLLARDLPRLDGDRRADTVAFIGHRVATLPSFTRFGVLVIAAVVDGVGRVAGPDRCLEAVLALPLPVVSEYPRLVRSLGYAHVWETWPDTAHDGAPT